MIRRSLARAGLLAALGTLGWSRWSTAQELDEGRWLYRSSPLAVAVRWLGSPAPTDRVRGIERLGTLGSPQAIEKLRAVAEATTAPALRLTLARALAPHARNPRAREILVRLVTSADDPPRPSPRSNDLDGTLGPTATELTPWVRQTAALALAQSGDLEAQRTLVKVARGAGAAAEAASQALIAHPPKEWSIIGDGASVATPAWVRTLLALGDQRAFGLLRNTVIRGSPEARAQAAVALTLLGALEPVELARHWVAESELPLLQEAGTRILLLARDPKATGAVRRLLSTAETQGVGLELAESAPSPDWVPQLEQGLLRVPPGQPEGRDAWWLALGRAGGVRAAELLGQEITRQAPSSRSSTAAFALANQAGAPARRALEAALGHVGRTRRWAARASVVRANALADPPRRLHSALEAMLASSDPADRAVAAWGLAACWPALTAQLLRAQDPVVRRGAASANFHRDTARHLLEPLKQAATPADRLALGWILAWPSVAAQVPTATLMSWLEPDSGIALMAVLALAARDNATLRPELQRLGRSADPSIRAHVALGLAQSVHPGALGLLERMYRFESEPRVRQALVRAVGLRREESRFRLLRQAAQLDGDPAVREAARLTLAAARKPRHPSRAAPAQLLGELLGDRAEPAWGTGPLTGTQVVWQELRYAPGPATGGVTLELASGLSVPALADPEGMVVRLGLPREPLDLRIWVAGQPMDSKAPPP